MNTKIPSKRGIAKTTRAPLGTLQIASMSRIKITPQANNSTGRPTRSRQEWSRSART
jgi:hypothetical protein